MRFPTFQWDIDSFFHPRSTLRVIQLKKCELADWITEDKFISVCVSESGKGGDSVANWSIGNWYLVNSTRTCSLDLSFIFTQYLLYHLLIYFWWRFVVRYVSHQLGNLSGHYSALSYLFVIRMWDIICVTYANILGFSRMQVVCALFRIANAPRVLPDSATYTW